MRQSDLTRTVPRPNPAWPNRIQGFAFQPYQKDQDAIAREEPTVAQIDADVGVLEGKTTNAVRNYSTLGTMGELPALAKRNGIRVTLGAWLDTDRARNEREIEQAIRLAKEHRNVVRIMVGNEVLLRGDLSRADLVAHLEHVRAATPPSATRSSSTA